MTTEPGSGEAPRKSRSWMYIVGAFVLLAIAGVLTS